MSEVMSLRLLIDVEEHNGGGDEIDNFTRWKLIQITAAVLSTVAIDLQGDIF